MIFLILSLISLFLILVIGKAFKKNLIPEIVLGLLVGLCWEITTAPLWNYNTTVFMVFYVENQEIPLDVILLWGAVLASASSAIDFMQRKIFKKINYKAFLLSTFMVFLVVGWLIEFTGTTYGFWKYSWSYNIFLLGVPVIPLCGWVFSGILYKSAFNFLRNM